MIRTLEWTSQGVRFIDQTRLPMEEVFVTCRTYQEVASAIRDMIVRGAPAIGVAAAMGIALGVQHSTAPDIASLRTEFGHICRTLGETRPTAVNLFWAIRLMPSSGGVLTHCNAGALATCGYGTALGVIRAAIDAGKKLHVFADETRPFLQGSRLTAWELMKDGIQTTLIADNMAGAMMRQGKIKAVIVGADRIAANGDVANKIGTYSVAVLAKEHAIPFYVAAPWSTVDMNMPDGEGIPIEQRSPREVTHHAGKQVAPDGVLVENPAFDVTPSKYVVSIITERGIASAPYADSLKELSQAAPSLVGAKR